MDEPMERSLMAKKNSPVVTTQMASQIKALLKAGMYQHDIAARFGINQGRISEIKTRLKFSDIEPIQGVLFPEMREGKS